MERKLDMWSFGNDKQTADGLFELASLKIKTATCSLYLDCEKYGLGLSILCNWDKTKSLLIRTTKLYICKFCEVSKEHAFKEGEDDRTYESWKSIHSEFFEKECKENGLKFCDDTLIVCEEFELA